MVFETTAIQDRNLTPVKIQLGPHEEFPETDFEHLAEQIQVRTLHAFALPYHPHQDDFQNKIKNIHYLQEKTRDFIANILSGTKLGSFVVPNKYYLFEDSQGHKRVFRIKNEKNIDTLERFSHSGQKWKKIPGKVISIVAESQISRPLPGDSIGP